MSKKYYAVRHGLIPGIYRSWDECKDNVHGVPKAEYKSFKTEEEALAYMAGKSPLEIKELEDIKEGELIAYVDGSYRASDHSYSYGTWLVGKNIDEKFNGRQGDEAMADMRNVAGEILGAEKAIARAMELGAKTLYIHYDYAGIKHWALGEWKRNREDTQAYYEYVQSIKEKIELVFIKVEAHSGIYGNELADQLAKEAE